MSQWSSTHTRRAGGNAWRQFEEGTAAKKINKVCLTPGVPLPVTFFYPKEARLAKGSEPEMKYAVPGNPL